jgi:hypothetical protein
MCSEWKLQGFLSVGNLHHSTPFSMDWIVWLAWNLRRGSNVRCLCGCFPFFLFPSVFEAFCMPGGWTSVWCMQTR